MIQNIIHVHDSWNENSGIIDSNGCKWNGEKVSFQTFVDKFYQMVAEEGYITYDDPTDSKDNFQAIKKEILMWDNGRYEDFIIEMNRSRRV